MANHFKNNQLVADLKPGDLVKVSIPGVEFLPSITFRSDTMEIFEEQVEYLGVFKKWRYMFDVPGPIEHKQGFCDLYRDVPDNADRVQLLMQVQAGTREFPVVQAPKVKIYQNTKNLYRLLYF
jgi:hypothetical protein